MKRMIIMLAGVAVLFGGIFGFKAFVDAKTEEFFDTMPEPVATVTSTQARALHWRDRVDTVGSFSAVQGTLLTPEVDGIVSEILFESGTPVEAGQALLVLASDVDQARLRSLEAALRLSRTELNRAQRLAAQRNLAEAELSRRQSETEQAEAAVSEQRARLRQKTLRAPFAGELGIRRVSVGQYVAPGDGVVSLQTRDPVFIDFTLPERFVPILAAGHTVAIEAAGSEAAVHGKVHAIEPRVSESTRTFAAQAVVPNPEGRLRPGMFGRVRLETGAPREVVVVPQSAIQFSPYGDAVFVVIDEPDGVLRVDQRFVQTGKQRGDLVEIAAGVQVGDTVVTSGLLKLRNGARVKLSDDPALRPGEDPDPAPANA